jgi:hypothetical protein
MHYEVLYAENLLKLQLVIEQYTILGYLKQGGITICSKEQYYQMVVKIT